MEPIHFESNPSKVHCAKAISVTLKMISVTQAIWPTKPLQFRSELVLFSVLVMLFHNELTAEVNIFTSHIVRLLIVSPLLLSLTGNPRKRYQVFISVTQHVY